MGETTVAIPEGGWGGGQGLAAGFGGLVGSWLGQGWSGGWGGWGNRGMAPGQGVADVTLQTGMQNLQNAVNQGAVAQAQGVGATGMQIANTGASINSTIMQQIIAALQGQSATQNQICCAAGRISQEIDQTGDLLTGALNQLNITNLQGMANLNEKLGQILNGITQQGYENRLQTQQLAAQIAQENCADREVMREIATQQTRDALLKSQNEVAELKSQLNQTTQLQNLAQYIIAQLTKTTTPATAVAG